ncbi:sigma-70 family RNA polymerase sigma factor [Corynebacterium sp. ES2794-CONJ1]|uniref:sigma-70 family RNA polymerase sigma factor n=1 Tax=unclassified Corynebacterium TaxID=2624378 RepID=UPI00216735C4|nr:MULTISPECIES: sigma-70 family RNA polymerase sigma factor [unclassified Corynebacterium]MCS4490465.1 sigma-70 family RNA polymerase sigma factor [Corynebacterium sp. ES2775-CONJ]MCS4532271.1 sigma-70 family RNA polymerase sigma factor [Corynebacterium sp. ES2730-CONJ]MCU9519764.1 sigma-70 family RNA polymerase sigma factor [Corynebacterium sp. ES2794-CONJ1]
MARSHQHDEATTRNSVERASAALEAQADEVLVADYLAGSDAAFAEIVGKHERHLRYVARKYARTEADAEDILQDALLRAARNLSGFRGDSKLSTWLHRLVANASYDHNRKHTHSVISADRAEFNAEVEAAMSFDPFAELIDRMNLSEEMQRALDLLPPEHRAALVLIDFAEHSVSEAAEILQVAPGTIKSRRARGRRMLKEILQYRVL